VFFSAVFSLVTPGVNGAILGLSVSYALQITQALKWLVRTMSDIETNVVSVERVQEYTQLVQEAPRYTSMKATQDWPSHGQVIFKQYSTKYRPELDPVLRGLDCSIQAGEKIGIVGRTGAGKSTLTLALFRLLEAQEGEIYIDNYNIASLGLQDLRSKITILPQEPVIFSGTLRENLDPNSEYLDQEIWAALVLSNMKSTVTSMPAGLYSEVGENGNSFSAGQRQLLCLTRALLRRSKLLILDEPTSSVDIETDTAIQTTVKKVFRHCTTITIAHRISSILDCDRVMVLDSGSIVEFDNPRILIRDEGSFFYRLAKSDGAL
jgi:ATP-binding cassette subfamily C (CFTR/MRP) protein 1